MSWTNSTLGSVNRGAYTKDAVRIASALNRAQIACQLEHTIVRYGEFNARGQQKTYSLDILIIDPRYRPVAIEVEGEGSASRDNDRRDRFLAGLGIAVLHVDNRTAGKDVIARLDGSFRRVEG